MDVNSKNVIRLAAIACLVILCAVVLAENGSGGIGAPPPEDVTAADSTRTESGAFPTKPIMVYVGFSAGGTTDVIARAIASVAQEYLGQPLVVINKPGASGTIAAREVANAKPDGYALLIAGGSETTCVGHFRKLSYHPIEAFAPIMRVARMGLLLNVRSDAPWNDLSDFVEDARSHPGEYIYASTGYGGLYHSAMLLLNGEAGLAMKHLPFESGRRALAALRGGHVDISLATASEVQALSEAMQTRSLVLTSRERSSGMPQVPTLQELGYDVYLENQKGFVAPAGTPQERIQVLHDALRKAFNHPDFVALSERLNIERAYLGPDAFGESLSEMYHQVGEVLEK